MTYVEFYDSATIENVCACLTCIPDQMVIMGFDADKLQAQCDIIQRLFLRRNQPLACSPYTVSQYDVPSAVRAIESIIDRYKDPVFDITGGDPLLVMALGIVLQRHSERRFQVHRFIIESHSILDCDRDGITVYRDSPDISVQETVSLYNGDVIFGGVEDPLTYRWKDHEEFVRDCEVIWSICQQHTSHWNKHLAAFHALIDSQLSPNSQTDYMLPRAVWDALLDKADVRYYYSERIGESLLHHGLLTKYDIGDQTVHIAFKNSQIKRALSKAGQALELHTFLTLKKLRDSDGNPMLHDVLNGVVIDWDGKRGAPCESQPQTYEVENEIDIMAMRHMVPIFVSCKNGYVDATELYKLEAVAERFGGTYAVKILILSSRSLSATAKKTFCQRAENMGIYVISDVDLLDPFTFSQEFLRILQT